VEHGRQAFDVPESLAESWHVLMNLAQYRYWLGVALERAGDESAMKLLEQAALERSDFQQMEVREVSEATYWSGRALQKLGRDEEARELFASVLTYAQQLETQPAVVDFFATSLPTMGLFEEDLADRQTTTALFLRAQAKSGLGEAEGVELLRDVLRRDPNHMGAIDMLRTTANSEG